jgi:hypothetical protein
VAGMQVAEANRVEASILHGQRGYGTVESVTDLGSNVAAVVITAATWAPGLWWAVGEKSTWDSFTSTTKNNGSGALILESITTSTRTLNITFVGTLASEITAGDVLYPEGAYDGSTHSDMPGLLSQIGTTTGSNLGLSATTYSNWRGNTYAVGGPISHGVIEDALSQLRDRGASGRLVLFVSNKGFSVLALELLALKLIATDASKVKHGIRSVTYVSADVGEVEIVNHPFMKQGEFAILPEDECERVGSSDVTFELPGRGDEIFTYLPDYNAVQLGCFADQAVICKRPNHAMLGTGITY